MFDEVDWKVLGLMLGVDDDLLEKIEKENSSEHQESSGMLSRLLDFTQTTTEYTEDIEQCQRSMLECWISTEHAYWSELVETLAGPVFQEIKVAEEISAHYHLGMKENTWFD